MQPTVTKTAGQTKLRNAKQRIELVVMQDLTAAASTPAAYLVGSLAAFCLLERTYGFLT